MQILAKEFQLGKFSEIEECDHVFSRFWIQYKVLGEFSWSWKVLVIINDFTRNIFDLEFAAVQYEGVLVILGPSLGS